MSEAKVELPWSSDYQAREALEQLGFTVASNAKVATITDYIKIRKGDRRHARLRHEVLRSARYRECCSKDDANCHSHFYGPELGAGSARTPARTCWHENISPHSTRAPDACAAAV